MMHLITPELVTENPIEAFASVFWLYMTPHYPRPSAHNVITGKFEPNSFDQTRFVGNDFGTSIAVMAQD